MLSPWIRNRYLKWIFGRANATQRQQVTDFSHPGHDVEYNGYLRTTPVSAGPGLCPEPGQFRQTETLLEEWNTVMKEHLSQQHRQPAKRPHHRSTATTITY